MGWAKNGKSSKKTFFLLDFFLKIAIILICIVLIFGLEFKNEKNP